MQYYFAPLEGLTDSTYRQLHHRFFPGIDRYYTPFLSPTVHRQLTPREARELSGDKAVDRITVPQLLTKNSTDFTWMAQQCADLGYKEVNLNLGCPSGTVTAKGKGAGMLSDHNALQRFLDDIFTNVTIAISVKTRIGFTDAQEFPALLDIFNRYPICELTVHPRVRKAFYNGSVDMDAFAYACENSKAPLCYNGNLCARSQIDQLQQEHPCIQAVMLGRGLIGDPGMLQPEGTDINTLQEFHDALLDAYLVQFGGSRNAMFRMKEHWRHLLCLFDGSEKLGKRLRKTTDITDFRAITREIFETLPKKDVLTPDW